MEKEKLKNKASEVKKKVSFFRTKSSLLARGFLFRYFPYIVSLIILVLGLYIRFKVIRMPYGDLLNFNIPWIREIKSLGFKNFYKVDGADYSSFYLFFLAIVSLLPEGKRVTISGYTFESNYRIAIKARNFVFDLLLAFSVFLLLKKLSKEKYIPFLGAWICFLLPIQYLNSALWGQCDNFWALSIVLALYFVRDGKDSFAWLFVGLGLAIKLQIVFILPLFAVFWRKKMVSLWKILFAFFGFFLTLLPALFCGAGFSEAASFIVIQIGRYSNLNLGCANRWHLFNSFSGDDLDLANGSATFLALGLIALCCIFVLIHNPDLKEKKTFILVSAFLINVVPFFLPHRHERYFYSRDILLLVYCLTAKKDYFLLPLSQLSGVIAYYNYLSRFTTYFFPSLGDSSVAIASLINLFLLLFLFYRIRQGKKGISREEEADERKIAFAGKDRPTAENQEKEISK